MVADRIPALVRRLLRALQVVWDVLRALGTLQVHVLLRRRKYRRLIEASGLFVPEHYLSQAAGARTARRDPVWHYLVEGARRGFDPNPLFDTSFYVERCPQAASGGKNPLVHFIRAGGTGGVNPSPLFDTAYYLGRYPDVRESGMNPLAHYLAFGAREGRVCLPPPPPAEVARPAELDPSAGVPFGFSAVAAGAPPLAVVCHLFHVDLAGDFRRYLSNIPCACDLFITTDTPSKRDVLERRFGDWERGTVLVRVSENRGRDIAPKLVTFRDVYPRYELVLHLHSKRSHHERALAGWRSYLLETLLGSRAVVESVLAAFSLSPRLGMIGAQHFEPIRSWIGWGENLEHARRLALRMGFQLDERAALDFPSGSMFWARSAALKPLLDLGLTGADFEPERGQTDGTTAHAVERLYYLVCERSGHDWIKIARPELCPATPAIASIDSREALGRFFAEQVVPLADPKAPAPRAVRPPPAPPAPALARVVQSRLLGGDGLPARRGIVVGIATDAPGCPEVGRTIESAALALRRAGGEGHDADVLVGADHGALMKDAFARGAALYVGTEGGALVEPDAVLALSRMAAAHGGLVLLEGLRFPSGMGEPYDPYTFDTPQASGASFAVPRAALDAIGSSGSGLAAPEAENGLSRRARAAGVPVRTCPRALFLDPPERRGGRAGPLASATIDTIVRFHDVGRLDELRRCVFSLVGQSHRPRAVILTLQRFTAAEEVRTREALQPLFAGRDAPALHVVHHEEPEPRDARSVLLNLGLGASTARFVAFLDYDDLLYPDAHARVVGRMLESGAAIGFASVRILHAEVFERFQRVHTVVPMPFSGRTLLDLFRSNFCPIHSYVIDRQQVSPDVLRFDATLSWEEDYDLLLRICARYRSDFSLVGTHIGDYLYKSDGSNTVPTGELSPERAARYAEVQRHIEAVRCSTEVSLDVQRALGLSHPTPGLTIRGALSAASGDAAARRRA